MDSTYLLVIDNSPDHAQIVNSFLAQCGRSRKSSFNASSIPSNWKTALKEKSPFFNTDWHTIAGSR